MTSRRRSTLTGRSAILALVLCGLTITLAYPVREFVAQRSQIADLRSATTEQRARVAELDAARRQWRDPAYVKAQARDRLHFVMPGETPYVVLDAREAPAPASAATIRRGPERPWFSDLWASVEAADATR